MTDLLVIGGGAVGLMAAGAACARGLTVTVLEHNPKGPGQKLLITGKGRCNLTSNSDVREFLPYVRRNGRFLYSSLYAFPPSAAMELFETLGVPLKTERGRRVFPQSDRAADVLAARGGAAQSGRWGGLLALAGLVAGIFPEVLLPSGLTEQTLFGIGAFLLLLGCARSAALQKLLSRSWLVRAGELSFALVLTHFTVLMSFSAWFFLAVQGQGLSYVPALTLTLATAVPVNYAFTLLFKLFAEGPAERFAHWIYRCVA